LCINGVYFLSFVVNVNIQLKIRSQERKLRNKEQKNNRMI
jgi:hypothetical protein